MSNALKEISTKELKKFAQNQEGAIIDTREIEAYNGWPLQGEARGGHIRGAKNFPRSWGNYKYELPELMKSKGLIPGTPLVLYGYRGEESREMARLFTRAGLEDIQLYTRFLTEWSPNEALPMDKLPRFQQLVYPAWLKELINGNLPMYYDNNEHVICHAHYGYREDYEKGHIPGAIDLDTNALESEETWNRRSPEELEKALSAHGIDKDTTVILYGRFSYPDNKDDFPGRNAGHLAAIRCAMIMLYAGVKDVRVLNGGLMAWENTGFGTTTKNSYPAPVKNFGARIPGRPEIIVDMPKAKELLTSTDGELVSVRSWPEFIGEVSGYNYIEKTGRIPGAIFGNCGTDAYHMENYRNPDHTLLEYHEIEQEWKQAGITPDKHLAFYCGTGWRGSEAFFNAYLMGWPRVSVFDGGWFEWSNNPANPIATGTPGEKEAVGAK